MAVAFDAASESHGGTTGSTSEASFSWSHAGGASARGVAVLVFQVNNTGDDVTSVTYGGTTVPDTGLTAADTATEPGRVRLFYLDNCGTGTKTVQVNRTNNANQMYAIAFTVTSPDPTEVYTGGAQQLSNNQAPAEVAVDDGSPGTNSFYAYGMYYGGASVPAAGANSTLRQSIDFGAFVVSSYTRQGVTGSQSVGPASSTSDDLAAIAFAVRKIPPAPTIPNPTSIGHFENVASSTTIVLPTSAACVSGDKAFFVLGWFSATGVLQSVSDDSGNANTYVIEEDGTNAHNGSDRMALVSCDIASLPSGSNVTFTLSAAGTSRYAQGMKTNTVATGGASATNQGAASTAAWSSGSVTVPTDGIRIGGSYNASGFANATNTPSGGNTEVDDRLLSGDSALCSEYGYGTGAVSGTWSTAAAYVAVAAAYGPATGTEALAAAPAGVATVAAQLTERVSLAASVAGVASVVGGLTERLSLAGAPAGSAVVSAGLTERVALAASPLGAGTVAGALTERVALAAALLGTGSVAGALSGRVALAAAPFGASVVTGDLSGTGGTVEALAAGVAGIGSPSALLTERLGLAGATAGQGIVTSDLTGRDSLAAAVSGSSACTGSLNLRDALAAAVAGSASVAGDVTERLGLAAAVAGSAALAGNLTGTGESVGTTPGDVSYTTYFPGRL